MTDAPVRRALISVSDKSGLIERARRLAALGVELVSTGGTSRALKEPQNNVLQGWRKKEVSYLRFR